MAKSSRATSNKKNHQALRRKIFDPADLARNERLNAKLQELIAQPKQKDLEIMDVEPGMKTPYRILDPAHDFYVQSQCSWHLFPETKVADSAEQQPEDALVEDMDVDGSTEKKTSSSRKRAIRVQKKRRGKAQSTILFPKFDKTRRSNKKGKGKK